MKKLFTLFTMLSLCIASTWAQDLDRTGWTILASSACDDSGSGQVNALTDGNTETFWHSRYDGGANGYGVINGGCPQAIQIDLGSVQEFNGIKISNRTDALGNGRVADYAVYVSNTAFTTSASGFSANEAKGDATPVLSGTFTNTAQEGAVNMAGRKTKLSGRYVLFVITSSVNVSQTAAYACIAEVNLFSIPDGSNAYIGTYNGTNNAVDQTKWQTEANWITTDTWNSNGPGTTGSLMWKPIYLNGVTASGISFEGWNLRIKLVNSSLTATANKIQAGYGVTSQFDVDQDSELNLTLSGDHNDDGPKVYNIDGSLIITTVSGHFTGISTNTVNLGTTGSFTFEADDSQTIGSGASFTINAKLTEPTKLNTVQSRTLATFTNVTLTPSSLTVSISGTEGWTLVDSREALNTQTSNGKYYYVDTSSGVTLYTFHETRYVTSDATLSGIPDYQTYGGFIVNSGVTLTVDVADFDLTKITGAGNIVLAASTSLTGNKATAATGKLTVNAGKTLTIGGGDSETNSVASFTSIDLKGTIKNNNSTTTLNSVTVPSDAEGKIYSYDMGNTADGFLLAGTTTVNGTLYVCNKLNFQMKVDKLTGSGTWTICGTEASDFDADGTSSTDAATVNVASATSFTGSTEVCNDKATVNVAGNLVASTWTKSAGTLKYTGASLAGTTLDGAVLAGSTYINTSGEVNIKNLAGNNLTGGGTYGYAFVGAASSTINFYGTCDLTKNSDGTDNSYSKVGYPSTAKIVIKENSAVKANCFFNSSTNNNNASVTVETGSTLTWSNTESYLWAKNITNEGTINCPSLIANTATLTGSGKVVLGTFPPNSSAPTLTDWTGTVEFPAVDADKGNLTAFFNAWGKDNSTIQLNSVTGYFNASETVNPTLDILSGATVTVNNGSSSSTPVLAKVTGAGTLAQTWSGGSGGYTLKIATLTGFTGTLRGTNKPIAVNKLVLASAPPVGKNLFNASGNVTLDSLYVGETDQTPAYAWAVSTKEGISGMYVTASAQQKITDAIALANTYYSQRLMGTGTGKYAVYIGETGYTDFTKFGTAASAMTTLAAWDGKNVRAVINLPVSGKFYRLKGSSSNKYAYSKGAGTQMGMSSTESDYQTAGLFYFNGNNTDGFSILNYNDGYYVYDTHSTGQLGNSTKFQFAEPTTTHLGTLTLYQTTNISNHGRWMYDNGSNATPKVDRNGGYVANYCDWYIEEASDIPVTFNPSALGYATFNSPVALAVPEGVEAYVCKIDGNNIKLFKANQLKTDGLWILPANTPVLLYNASYKTDATKYFTVTSTDEKYDNNGFYGTSASEAPVATKYLYYALRKKSDRMGFYQRADQEATLTGFRAWIRSDKAAGARNFVISFDGDSDPTGIAEALGLQDEKVEIYDLNGRKLTGYQKGINIVNGKKVFK